MSVIKGPRNQIQVFASMRGVRKRNGKLVYKMELIACRTGTVMYESTECGTEAHAARLARHYLWRHQDVLIDTTGDKRWSTWWERMGS